MNEVVVVDNRCEENEDGVITWNILHVYRNLIM